MKKWIVRLSLSVPAVLLIGAGALYGWLHSMGLYRAPVYDTAAPALPALSHPAVLVLYKTNGYVHAEAIPAANALFKQLAQRHGYAIYLTDNGAVINSDDLKRFDVVVWNNNTGDILTGEQQRAFRNWLEGGGKWLGLHGASGDHFPWTWFVDEVIGATFNTHTLNPPYARAKLVFEQRDHPILAGLPASLWLTDELYSFSTPPRAKVHVLATLDESTYMDEQGWVGRRLRLRMGDHPIIWWRNVGRGTAVYSGIGHKAETYAMPEYRQLLDNTLTWLIAGAVSDAHPAAVKP
jgi:type 1 glutamine amidotransferase